MQAEGEISKSQQALARQLWLEKRDQAILGSVALTGGVNNLKDIQLQKLIKELQDKYPNEEDYLNIPIHKQIANRLLEPFMWHTAIVTATDWDNFYALRANKNAQPEIQKIAYMMQDVHNESEPEYLNNNQWHLPFIQYDELSLSLDSLIKISAGRSARVSYLTHNGVRDTSKDIDLYESLKNNGHMSPLEHVARPMNDEERDHGAYSGNFKGWHQHRKDIVNEDNFAKVIS